MGNSNAIAAAVALAFILFITLRGELPDYLRLFKPQKHPETAAANFSSGSSGGASGGSTASDIATAAQVAAMFA